MTSPLLVARDLGVCFGPVTACRSISLTVHDGEVVGVAGASGSGKTISALAIARLLPRPGRVVSGSVSLDGEDLLACSESRMREVRGRTIDFVFQDASRALDPLRTLDHHLREAGGGSSADVGADLERVGLDASLAGRYAHQLSGGQRQRAMIAIATARRPRLVIVDEPTSALDSLTQIGVLHELTRAVSQFGSGLLLVSHDVGVLSRVCDRVVIVDDGCSVEDGAVVDVLTKPKHRATQALLDVVLPDPPLAEVSSEGATLELRNVTKRFARSAAPAVDSVTIRLHRGETYALVGESGSGKTTAARIAAFLQPPDEGSVRIGAVDPFAMRARSRRQLRAEVQIAFQDSGDSLDPRQRVFAAVCEPFQNFGVARAEREARVAESLADVGIDDSLFGRRTNALSGGQRQRVALARALVLRPAVLLLDEPVAALDRALVLRMVELIRFLQQRDGWSAMLISHDLHVVGACAHRIGVMHRGRIVEEGAASDILNNPKHDYTRALCAARLTVDPNQALPNLTHSA